VRIPRIYQPVPLTSGQIIKLDAQATVHLTKVLRLRVGDTLTLFNGIKNANGHHGEFTACVNSVARRSTLIEIGKFVTCTVESPLELVLLQGISRGERMDYTVQKAVELGVSRIIPILSARTMVNLKDDRQEKRRVHWQKVVNSACEQCGRNRVPTVEAVKSFAAALVEISTITDNLKLVLHHRAETNLTVLTPQQRAVSLLVGPEGGLSAQEISAAEAAGFIPLQLGPRILRTETAALAALSVLQWHWGDFSAEVAS